MNVDRGVITRDDVDLFEQIETAGDIGFDFVEIFMQGSGDRTVFEDEATALREALSAAGLDCLVHLPFTRIDLGSPHEHVREGARRELSACLDAAAAVGARKAIAHPVSGADDPDEQRRLMAEGVRRVDEAAAGRDIELCVENMFGKYVTVHDLDHVVADTDASLVLDTGHARIEGSDEAETAAFLAEHADRVSHLHLNDTVGRSDDHLPVGAGTIDFGRLFEPLAAADWSGTMTIETTTTDPTYRELALDRLDAVLGG
jgi:sugar phosphate isomerase/epimerase